MVVCFPSHSLEQKLVYTFQNLELQRLQVWINLLMNSNFEYCGIRYKLISKFDKSLGAPVTLLLNNSLLVMYVSKLLWLVGEYAWQIMNGKEQWSKNTQNFSYKLKSSNFTHSCDITLNIKWLIVISS